MGLTRMGGGYDQRDLTLFFEYSRDGFTSWTIYCAPALSLLEETDSCITIFLNCVASCESASMQYVPCSPSGAFGSVSVSGRGWLGPEFTWFSEVLWALVNFVKTSTVAVSKSVEVPYTDTGDTLAVICESFWRCQGRHNFQPLSVEVYIWSSCIRRVQLTEWPSPDSWPKCFITAVST